MRIIPAIDIIDGKCVRLSKGDYNTKKVYHENPMDVAKAFEDFGWDSAYTIVDIIKDEIAYHKTKIKK